MGIFTPSGPGILEIIPQPCILPGSKRFIVRAHGGDRDNIIARAASIVGTEDNTHQFTPKCTVTRRLVRASVGLRLTTAPSLFDLLVRLILQQRVAWKDAAFSYRRLATGFGSHIGAHDSVVVPPSPAKWLRIPPSTFASAGVDRKRADTIRRVAKVSHRIAELQHTAPQEIIRRLTTISGLGPWTIQKFLGIGLGYPDAVPLGDYDLPHRVAMTFLRQPRSNEEEMLALLAPYRGQRWRLIRMIEEGGPRLPRYAPRRVSLRRP